MDAGQNSNPEDGQTWATAFEDLQDAIDVASAGDCIWVAAGRYTPTSGTDRSASFTIGKSLNLYGGFDGSEACWDDRGSNYSGTRLQGDIGVTGDDTDNSYIVVQIYILTPVGSPPGKVVIDGFSIRDAYNDQSGGNGGGISMRLTNNHLDLRNCVVRDNQSSGDGAGLYVQTGSFNVSLTKFASNSAGLGGQLADGGALWASDILEDCLLHNVEFKNNSATRNGGAFFGERFGAANNNWLRFANGLFHGNTADKGGAGYLADQGGGLLRAQADLTNCTLSGNSAVTDGEALFAEETYVSGQPQLESPKNAKLFLLDTIVWGNDTSSRVIAATESSLVTFGSSDIRATIVEPQGSYWDCSQGVCFTQALCLRFACDPLFVGTTFRLSAGSPAIDETNSMQPGAPLPFDVLDVDDDGNTTEALPWDLDGRPRVSPSGLIDIGSYEF